MHSKVTENIFFCILLYSGYITRNPVKTIDFLNCAILMVQQEASTDLIQAPYGSCKIGAAAKKAFKLT